MFVASLVNLIPIVLFVGVPLICATIIARRMGRGRLVVSLPLGLAAVFSVVSTLWIVMSDRSGDPLAAAMLTSVSLGGFTALFVSLIVLASVGVKRDRMAPVEAF